MATQFPPTGSALERYAARMPGVEINSSFYRSHRPATWARWAASVPAGFRFAVKMPRTISHERRLIDCEALLATFLEETASLGEKLAVLLLQLPPTLVWQSRSVEDFLSRLTASTSAVIVCEPRHPSWFRGEADCLLAQFGVARAAADPARAPAAAYPGGSQGLHYWRLHGSPRIYWSAYDPARLACYAAHLREGRAAGRPVWCILDNTAAGAALANALALRDLT